MTDTGKKPF